MSERKRIGRIIDRLIVLGVEASVIESALESMEAERREELSDPLTDWLFRLTKRSPEELPVDVYVSDDTGRMYEICPEGQNLMLYKGELRLLHESGLVRVRGWVEPSGATRDAQEHATTS